MNFDTAIFYDIENLTKGYRVSQQITEGLSLKEILARIRSIQGIGKPAVQRAYANWSDNRLWFLKNDLLELGIDPVQVFNFVATTYTKNIADIQLAVDVMDVMHKHPSIENMVIVSGDGGYASLVKKLHEYGKTVIGCAYGNTTNKVFKAVCDHFVPLTDPGGIEKPVNCEGKGGKPLHSGQVWGKVVQPLHSGQVWAKVKELAHLLRDFPEYKTVLQAGINAALLEEQTGNGQPETGRLSPDRLPLKESQPLLPGTENLLPGLAIIEAENGDGTLQKIKDLIPLLVKRNEDWENNLKTTGINLSVLKESIIKEISGFNPWKFGFAKFSECLRFLLKDSAFGVWQGTGTSSSETKFGYRKYPLPGLSLLPHLEARETHSADCYRSVLENGSPKFRLPGFEVLKFTAENLQHHQPFNENFESVSKQLGENNNSATGLAEIEQALHCFLAAGCFQRKPEKGKLSEQHLTLKNENKTSDNLLQQLRAEMQKKILFSLGDCKSLVFEETLRYAGAAVRENGKDEVALGSCVEVSN